MQNFKYSARSAIFDLSSYKKLEKSIQINDDVVEYIDICLKNKLYVAGWTLRPMLLSHKEKIDNNIFSIKKDMLYFVNIGICVHEEKPIALNFQFGSIYTKGLVNKLESHAFVRKNYRRQKIGSKMFMITKDKIEKQIEEYNISFSASTGIKKSEEFWKHLGIDAQINYLM